MSNTGRLTAVVHQGDLGKKEVNWAIRHCLSFKCVETSNFVQIADNKIQHHDSKMIPEYKGLCPLPEQAFQSSLYSGLGPPWNIWGRLKKKAKVFFTSLSIHFQRTLPVQVAGWQNHHQWSQGDPPASPSHAWLVKNLLQVKNFRLENISQAKINGWMEIKKNLDRSLKVQRRRGEDSPKMLINRHSLVNK